MDQLCDRIGARLNSVRAQLCRKVGLVSGESVSHDGLPLVYRDFVPAEVDAPPPRVLLIGGIHGDELSSVSIVFQWMQKLDQKDGPAFHWRVIPSSNPDGLLAPKASRTNAYGVDLNRNFPTADWNSDALRYWKRVSRGDVRRFPGPAAASEPETRWLAEQIREFQPDAIISVHAPFGILDFDGPLTPPHHLGYLILQPIGVYPGSLGNYAGVTLGLPTITLELPNANTMPTAEESQQIWDDMLAWLDKNLPKKTAGNDTGQGAGSTSEKTPDTAPAPAP
ncbi:MAG: M14 family murein peptide amidase A [Panacagrimonas sp.]